MHFSKVSLVICVLAAASTPAIRAEDNPAQAKAREALVSKLFEISAQEPVTNPPAAPTKPVMEKSAPAPKPVPAPVVKSSDEPVMMPVTNGDAKAKAKAEQAAKAAQAKADQEAKAAEVKAQKEASQKAAAQKVADEATAKARAKADAEKAAADLKAQKAAAKKAADQKAAEIAAAKKQVKTNLAAPKNMEPAKPVEATMSVPASNGDTPAQAKARQALANSLFEEAAAAPVTPATPPALLPPDSLATKPEILKPTMPAPEPAQKDMTPAPAPKTVMASTPIGMAPPLPISADKQQKLQELLAKYRADQVTPDEYQKQRAAILAEP